MQNIKKLSYLLSYNERLRVILLLIMILIMALIDMLGIASILPFIAILTNPLLIETNTILNNVYQTANKSAHGEVLLPGDNMEVSHCLSQLACH